MFSYFITEMASDGGSKIDRAEPAAVDIDLKNRDPNNLNSHVRVRTLLNHPTPIQGEQH